MLYLPRAGSTLLYLVLLALVTLKLTSRREVRQESLALSYWLPLLVVSIWWVIAVLATQLVHGVWHPSGFEKAIRALCLVPVIYFFCRMPLTLMRHVQWGFMLAALSGAWGLIFPLAVFSDGLQRPDTSQYALYNTVGHANFVMLFACLSLASIGWRCTRFIKTEIALKLAVTLIGFYGVLESQTRSSLVAIPVFLLIAWLAKTSTSKRSKAIFLVATIAVLAFFGTSRTVQDRVGLAYSEIQQCQIAPNADTSVCIRLQLLRAAKTMIHENPIFGVGDGNLFTAAMQDLGQRQVISEFVANNWGETHNDLSFITATYGVFGLIPFVLCYFGIPGWLLIKNLATQDATRRTAAIMGLLVISGFLAFGLTEAMYRSMRTISVYIVLIGLFIAMSRPQPKLEKGNVL